MAFTVLVVDDSPVMRTFIRRVMKLAGFEDAEYLEASDGHEALERLEARRADVVLTDITMPRMGGEEFLEEMERRGMLSSMPALVISTDATRDCLQRMLTLGARGYISKPFTPESLREQLDRVLGVANV